MSDPKKVASFEEIERADDIQYDYVEAYGKTVRVGSLNSDDMIEWMEEREDKEKKRTAGLRLVVRSLVDDQGNRIPKDQREGWITLLGSKDAKSNARVFVVALKLNGLSAKGVDYLKNASGEATTVASPSGSPLPPAT